VQSNGKCATQVFFQKSCLRFKFGDPLYQEKKKDSQKLALVQVGRDKADVGGAGRLILDSSLVRVTSNIQKLIKKIKHKLNIKLITETLN